MRRNIERREIISVKDALKKMMEHISILKSETVPLGQAYKRILAEPIFAEHDVPRFHRSPYDGYAIRSVDSVGASGENRVAFSIVHKTTTILNEGEAVRVATGAPLPENADAVVMLEQTVSKENSFTIRKLFSPNENVSLQGEDVTKGEELLTSGEMIHPGIVALLATFGYATVKVSQKPIVGIVSMGTELLDLTEELAPGKIRNSNEPMLIAQLARMGLESRVYKVTSDHYDDYLTTVKKALEETDCLITTGGVSVGDDDFLPRIYDEINAEVLFNKVAMRPGSVTTVATAKEKMMFGLSGNPSACFTAFELFARPALLAMMGVQKCYLPYVQAELAVDYVKANPFTRFIRAHYKSMKEGAFVTPASFNKSNSVSSIAKANALLVFPQGTKGFKKGTDVDVLLLGAEEGVETWEI